MCGNPASTDLCRVIEENNERKYDEVFLEVFYSVIYGDTKPNDMPEGHVALAAAMRSGFVT